MLPPRDDMDKKRDATSPDIGHKDAHVSRIPGLKFLLWKWPDRVCPCFPELCISVFWRQVMLGVRNVKQLELSEVGSCI